LWSLPSAVGFIVGSTIAPRIIHRFRPSVVMGVGMAIAAVGTAMLIGLSVDGDGSLLLIAGASVIISIGLAPVITLATELIVGSAPPEQAGAATGISETSGELGGALGIAILGSLGTAVYRAELGDSLPSDLPSEVADAALDTLGGAMAIAETLPGAIGDAVVAAAQIAFVDALHIVAAVAAIGAAATAIVAAAALWTVPARADESNAEGASSPVGAAE
jgi:MFS transporter, DHA2 family, multidrug resistance protein